MCNIFNIKDRIFSVNKYLLHKKIIFIVKKHNLLKIY
jgi:hypothetical protein